MGVERQLRRTFLRAEARTSFAPDEQDNPALGPLLAPEDLYRLALSVPTPVPDAPCPPLDARFWAARLTRTRAATEAPAEEGLVLELPAGRRFTLNEAGAFVWSRLTGDRTLAGIVADLGHSFDASEEVLRTDVFHIIRAFAREGLLIPERSAP